MASVGMSASDPVMDNVARRPYRLSDWVFAFGFPDVAEDFPHAFACGEFCLMPPPLQSFEEYRTQVLDPFEQRILPLERAGLNVLRYPSTRQLAAVMYGTTPVVLLTHSNGRALELRDGMVPYVDFARRVDRGFHGIADISACESRGLLPLLKARAPRCAVKVANIRLSYQGWLSFYTLFLAQFHPGPCCFGDAFLAAASELLGDQPVSVNWRGERGTEMPGSHPAPSTF
jgi:hypothetical protein